MEFNLSDVLRQWEEKQANELVDFEGETYSTKQLHRIPRSEDELRKRQWPPTLTFPTLSGLVKYINSVVDTNKRTDNMSVVVATPTCVCFYTDVNIYGERFMLAKAEIDTPANMRLFDHYLNQEEFITWLSTSFADNKDKAYVLELASRIKIRNEADLEDNGTSQTVTVSQGAATVGTEKIKPTVELAPYRTFQDVAQPASFFVLRIDKEGRIALFSDESKVWKVRAGKNIEDYLKTNIEPESCAYIFA